MTAKIKVSGARFLCSITGLLLLAVSGSFLTVNAAKPAAEPAATDGPVVTDWSHQHVIFSMPKTAEQARLLARDPRFQQQLNRRAAALTLPRQARIDEAAAALHTAAQAETQGQKWWRWRKKKIRRDWSEDLGTNATVGAGNYPAKFSFKIHSVSCANDFVVFNTGPYTVTTQASIVAYNNLYSGCTTHPSVYWSYNTGGQIETSVSYSEDGSQIAFVQTSGGAASLVLLKWKAGDGTSVGSPASDLSVAPPSTFSLCAAPCMTSVALHKSDGTTTTDDTTSSVFIDYASDVAWIGGSGGWLHKISPVFTGPPAEVADGHFPAELNNGAALTDPVYDGATTAVYVGDANGFLFRVDSAFGSAAVTSTQPGSFGSGITQGPIVDIASGVVYLFISDDGTDNCSGGPCAGVFQFSPTFAQNDPGLEVAVGIGSATNPMYIGSFDSTYINSTGATGNLYVCGNTGGPPSLYQVHIASSLLISSVALVQLSTDTGAGCSPVLDIANPTANGGTEWIFASTPLAGTPTGCGGGAGCIFNFKVTPWLPNTEYAVGQEVLDSNLDIQTVIAAGLSGASPPAWSTTAGGTSTGSAPTWIDQGRLAATTLSGWAATHAYSVGDEILDPNNNVEVVTAVMLTGVSGFNQPTWPTTAGGTVGDPAVLPLITWTNAGSSATSALGASGGTSGIIIDNVVSSSTQVGASQVYFSTLSDDTSCTGGTGGCAVQASQQGLN